MSQWYGFPQENELSISDLLVILHILEKKGYGEYILTVRGEYALTAQHEIEIDNCAIDFYGNA
jgi:hypothetical protein